MSRQPEMIRQPESEMVRQKDGTFVSAFTLHLEKRGLVGACMRLGEFDALREAFLEEQRRAAEQALAA